MKCPYYIYVPFLGYNLSATFPSVEAAVNFFQDQEWHFHVRKFDEGLVFVSIGGVA